MVDGLLTARHICKSFGGLQALNDVSFSVPANSIYGIIGPNGAGKTTLFNVLTGFYEADSGSLGFDGRAIEKQEAHRIVEQGLARTFQNIRLFNGMTVLENVMIGRHARSHAGIVGAVLRAVGTRKEERDIRERSQALLDYVGLAGLEHKTACELSYGDQRRLEIARALATEPKLIALDEPAAGMNPAETLQLQALLQKLIADHRVSILLIEHDIRFVMNLCQRILVLDHGVVIADDEPAVIRHHPGVIEAYLGPAA